MGKDKYYKLLTKSDLIDIIKSDEKTKRKAKKKIRHKILQKIQDCEEEIELCDPKTESGKWKREVLCYEIRKQERILRGLEDE